MFQIWWRSVHPYVTSQSCPQTPDTVSEMTYNVSSWTLNLITHSLTHRRRTDGPTDVYVILYYVQCICIALDRRKGFSVYNWMLECSKAAGRSMPWRPSHWPRSTPRILPTGPADLQWTVWRRWWRTVQQNCQPTKSRPARTTPTTNPPSTASQNYITSDTAHTHYNCLHTPHSYRTLHLLHKCCIKIHIRYTHIWLITVYSSFIHCHSLCSLRSVKRY